MIDRDHDLLRLEPELHRHLLDGINRGAVHVRLTGFAQATVTHMDAKAFQETLERRRATVHGGGLHHLRRQETPADPCAMGRHRPASPRAVASTGCLRMLRRLPTARTTSVTGVTRSTSTSIVPGRPCWRGMTDGESDSRRSSTRIWPSRASCATRVTVAARLPYCVQGKP